MPKFQRHIRDVQGDWNNSLTDRKHGHVGSNVVYDAATRQAALQLRILPQELHAVTWNSIRELLANMDRKKRAHFEKLLENAEYDFAGRKDFLLRQDLGSQGSWMKNFDGAAFGRSSYRDGMRLTAKRGTEAKSGPRPKPTDILELILEATRMANSISNAPRGGGNVEDEGISDLVESYLLGKLVKKAPLATKFRYIE